ncbi:hypothetical protein Tco_1329703 [Tanacetum coccineum]
MSFVGSSVEKTTNGSTIQVHEATLPGSVCLRTCLELDGGWWIKIVVAPKHIVWYNKSLLSTTKNRRRSLVKLGIDKAHATSLKLKYGLPFKDV